MTKVWRNYITDTNYNYSFVPVNIRQISELNRDVSPLLVLPQNDIDNSVEIDSSCNVPGLTYRKIRLFFSDESIYEINYYRPFTQDLFNWLSNSISVRAFELIGEQIRYSRLIKMLNRE